MDQRGEYGRAQKQKRNDDKEKTCISLKRAAIHDPFFKIDTGPEGEVGQQLINGGFISEAVGIVDPDFDGFFLRRGKGIGEPACAAKGISEQRIFYLKHIRFIFALIKSQVDVIGIKGNGCITAIKPNVLAVGRQHMEITPQSHITLGGGDMLAAYDFLPRAVADAVIAVEINFSRERKDSLIAVGISKPKQCGCTQQYKGNGDHSQHRFVPKYLVF